MSARMSEQEKQASCAVADKLISEQNFSAAIVVGALSRSERLAIGLYELRD